MVGWHHGLDGHVFEQAPGVGDGQGGWVQDPALPYYSMTLNKLLKLI